MCATAQSARFGILKTGVNMRRVPKSELLKAMKSSLRELENVKILSPDDIEILRLRRTVRQQIDQLEKENSQDYEVVFSAWHGEM
jgi:3-methyladenine DNA glycosylase AlkC